MGTSVNQKLYLQKQHNHIFKGGEKAMIKKNLSIILISFLLTPIVSYSQDDSLAMHAMHDFDDDFYVQDAENGDIDAVKQFINNGINIDVRNQLSHTALMRAAYGGHPEVVKFLIENGADVNLSTWEGHTSLYFAVIENRVEIAELLIENGADVNIEFDAPTLPYSSLVFKSMDLGYEKMADMLIASGANPHDKQMFLKIQLCRALSEGNEEVVKDLISREDVNIDGSSSILLRYVSGSEKTKSLIRKYGLPEIKSGKSNLLDALLEKSIHKNDRCEDPDFDFPLATTFLHNAKQPSRYAPDKAFDGELSTSWVEGVEGSGIGQKIAFEISKAKGLSIMPGFGKDAYFKKNNRIRKARLSILEMQGQASQTEVYIFISAKLYENIVEFKDEMTMQKVDFPEPLSGIAVLEILEVYPGERWDDTCIAEIKILK